METRIRKQTLKLYEVQAKESTTFFYHVYAPSPEEVERLVKEGQVVVTRRGDENRKIMKITEMGDSAKRYSGTLGT
jgi:hypothetical protein